MAIIVYWIVILCRTKKKKIKIWFRNIKLLMTIKCIYQMQLRVNNFFFIEFGLINSFQNFERRGKGVKAVRNLHIETLLGGNILNLG